MYVCMYICMYIQIYIHTYVCMHACMLACIFESVCLCIHTYMHTHIHAYIHTCIHTYIHTYIYTYIRTYILRIKTQIHACYGVTTISKLLKITGLFCQKKPYKRDDILQKRFVISRTLLIVATPCLELLSRETAILVHDSS